MVSEVTIVAKIVQALTPAEIAFLLDLLVPDLVEGTVCQVVQRGTQRAHSHPCPVSALFYAGCALLIRRPEAQRFCLNPLLHPTPIARLRPF